MVVYRCSVSKRQYNQRNIQIAMIIIFKLYCKEQRWSTANVPYLFRYNIKQRWRESIKSPIQGENINTISSKHIKNRITIRNWRRIFKQERKWKGYLQKQTWVKYKGYYKFIFSKPKMACKLWWYKMCAGLEARYTNRTHSITLEIGVPLSLTFR